jgi:hypothetical protein
MNRRSQSTFMNGCALLFAGADQGGGINLSMHNGYVKDCSSLGPDVIPEQVGSIYWLFLTSRRIQFAQLEHVRQHGIYGRNFWACWLAPTWALKFAAPLIFFHFTHAQACMIALTQNTTCIFVCVYEHIYTQDSLTFSSQATTLLRLKLPRILAYDEARITVILPNFTHTLFCWLRKHHHAWRRSKDHSNSSITSQIYTPPLTCMLIAYTCFLCQFFDCILFSLLLCT